MFSNVLGLNLKIQGTCNCMKDLKQLYLSLNGESKNAFFKCSIVEALLAVALMGFFGL